MDRRRRLPGGPAILAAVGSAQVNLGECRRSKQPFAMGCGRRSTEWVGNTSSSSRSRERPKLGGMDDQRVFHRPSPRGPCRVIVYPPSHPNGPELATHCCQPTRHTPQLMALISSSTTAGGRRGWRKGQRTTKMEGEDGRTRRMVSDLFTIGPDRQSVKQKSAKRSESIHSFTHRMRVSRLTTVKWVKCNAFVGLLTMFFPADGRRDPLKAFIARIGVELFLFASDLSETEGQQKE
ncbi:hypothetical protein niasHT_030162 [Heterodera trifolii]|uniref:Uncharacterized protein n=1 Tax=Heterodera trifolii TaxID=157864 RepID=A0ABD2K2S6_9BILA